MRTRTIEVMMGFTTILNKSTSLQSSSSIRLMLVCRRTENFEAENGSAEGLHPAAGCYPLMFSSDRGR